MKKNFKKKSVFLILGIMLISFNQNNESQLNAQNESKFRELRGPYLGQKPPGMKPEIFTPGIVSTSNAVEFSCTFSPDGNEFYFTRRKDGGGPNTIMITRRTEKGWTAPEIATFSGKHIDFEPHITPDGSRMFFNRRDPSDATVQDGIWVVERSGDCWGEPRYIGIGMYATTTRDGAIYMTDRSVPFEEQGIVKTRLLDGKFTDFEWQEGGVNSPAPGRRAGRHPFIAPDESFIIFDSYNKERGGEGRLFVCFRRGNGSWSKAFDLGDDVNFAAHICASISPDGKYLFYAANGDIYWVDAKIIEKFKPLK